MTKLLTNPQSNTKISKSIKQGYLTYGIHLAPFNLSGFNVCANASSGCASACLNTAGRGRMTNIQKARIAKTKLFFSDKKSFLLQLSKEIKSAIKSAEKKDMIPCFRLNLTSDLPWEGIKLDGLSLMEMFPDVQFYDYTNSTYPININSNDIYTVNYYGNYDFDMDGLSIPSDVYGIATTNNVNNLPTGIKERVMDANNNPTSHWVTTITSVKKHLK